MAKTFCSMTLADEDDVMIATLIGSFLIFLIAGAFLALGQWFGRPPITGKCSPDNPACCMNRQGEKCKRGGN